MKGVIANGLVLLALVRPADPFSVYRTVTPRVRSEGARPWRPLERVSRKASLLLSTRNINENGEPYSDLHLSSSAVDGNPVVLYRNETVVDDDDDGACEMSSVTDWSDFMRQDYWLQHRVKDGSISSNGTASESSESPSTFKLDDSILSKTELEQIETYWDRLLPTVNYLGTVQVATIYKALRVAYLAHRGQMRKSGEPFIVHVRCCLVFICFPSYSHFVHAVAHVQPLEVALLLSGLKMDAETVIAGLLHDTVEDTNLTFAQVEAFFGRTVRSIVEGETKVSKLPKQLALSEYADEQAENLRQMFVAMTDDYRIIIVKLADRLHNMRTLKFMKPEKQIKISRETLDIFAPLAHRMGIWQFKSELEDTAFMYLYPLEYKRLDRRLQQHQKKFKDTLDKAKELLQNRLDNDPTLKQQAVEVEVQGRRKEIYSLWHKMETKMEPNLENILDVVALRVIISPAIDKQDSNENETDRGVWLCYHVLGLVQHLHGFQPVPTKVKDYISFPVRSASMRHAFECSSSDR
jgi:HD domain/Region found in RelA / SpoT proteins